MQKRFNGENITFQQRERSTNGTNRHPQIEKEKPWPKSHTLFKNNNNNNNSKWIKDLNP